MAFSCSIDTARYYRSHLKQPKGRGSWLFENRAGEIVFQHNGPYGEAKKAAMAYGREHGHAVLFACP